MVDMMNAGKGYGQGIVASFPELVSIEPVVRQRKAKTKKEGE
jgi:hypothetical protein